MKKYLTSGALAIIACGFMTSCHETEIDYASQIEAKKATFAENFVKFYGEIDPNQDWGFGTTTRGITRTGNTGETYPATHVYKDASGNVIAGANCNANQWADATLNGPDEFGGWVVPDELSPEQKALVTRYFQTVNDMDYQDPHLRHFFVQQVHKGGNTKVYNTTEGIIAADNTPYTSDNMNLLTVGIYNSHINNFNRGTYSVDEGSTYGEEGASGVGVLNKDHTTNEFGDNHHTDQIMLMVNVDDTQCMGYHCSATGESGPNAQRNDKAALVSWETIAKWQVDNHEISSIEESILNDDWDRSFVGFDLALKPFDECVDKDNDGNIKYAKIDQIPSYENYQYIWDGNKVLKRGNPSPAVPAQEVDITSTFAQNPFTRNVTCSYSNGIINCVFAGQWDNSITFIQNADWSQYDKLVIEFAEPSPINATLSCGENVQISVGDRNVEVATPNWAYSGAVAHGPTISNSGVGTESKTLIIKKVTLVKNGQAAEDPADFYQSEYILVNGNQKIPFLSRNTNQYAGESFTVNPPNEWITWIDGKQCIDLTKIGDLVKEKKYPTSTALRDWSTWEDGDGYYSDWIVTLTEAKRISETTTTGGTITTGQTTTGYYLRKYVQNHRWVFCEDLGSASNKKDFDYNDLVFDAKIIQEYEVTTTNGKETVVEKNRPYALITPLAAGGELSITVAGHNVHGLFKLGDDVLGDNVLINTIDPNTESEVRSSGVQYAPTEPGRIDCTTSVTWPTDDILEIPIYVQIYKDALKLLASKGEAPHKIAVTPGTRWAQERVDINDAQPGFANWVKNVNVDATFWSSSESSNRYPYMPTDDYLTNNMTGEYLPDDYISGETKTNYSVNLASNEDGIWFDGKQLNSGSEGAQISNNIFVSKGAAQGSIIRIYGVSNSSWELNVYSDSETIYQKSGDSLFGYVEFKLNDSTAAKLRSSGMDITGNGLNILCVSIDNTFAKNTSN